MSRSLCILGLDPGLHHTGWGVVVYEGACVSYRAHSTIHTVSHHKIEQRLSVLYRGLCDVIDAYQPHVAAVEETFLNKNPASSLKLSLARGVVLLAPGMSALPVTEYSANHIKKTVVGVGHATKDQVALMVRMLLKQPQLMTNDGTDALAVAICHAHHHAATLKEIPDQRMNQRTQRSA